MAQKKPPLQQALEKYGPQVWDYLTSEEDRRPEWMKIGRKPRGAQTTIPKGNYSKKDFPDAVRGGYQISPTTAYWHAAHRKSDADVAKILSDPKNQYFELYGGVKPNPPSERKNENGIEQKGRDLSGSQLLLEVPELDANRFIQPSEGATPAPGAGLNLNMPGVSAESFYKQPPIPFPVSDEAGPKFAMEINPESLKASENAFSTDMTKYTPLLTNIQETEAKKEEPKPSRQRGSARQQEFAARPGNQPFGGEEPATADLVSPMYANAARNAARNAVLDVRPGEGPMGTIRRRNAAVGLNAAGNIAKIDGKLYNVTKDQAWALTGGAGNTREGLDAIKNAATLYEAPGTQSVKVDTSNLTPGAKAAVDLAMSGPKPFTTQGMNDQNAGEYLQEFTKMRVNALSPAEQTAYNAAISGPAPLSTKGLTDDNAEEFMKRFRASIQTNS